MYDCIQKQGFEWKINANGLLEALSELSSICGGRVCVSINNHPEFHQSTGNLMLTATKVMEMCANAGVVVTDNDLMWKQVSRLTDSNYSCAGDSKLFYVLQKRLIVEMIMDVLTLDAHTVSDLEDACAGVSPLQSMCLRAQQAEMSAITTSRTSPLTSTIRRNIMKSSEEKARRSVGGMATMCERSGTTSMTWRIYSAHNVTQKELKPRPIVSTMRIIASTTTRTG